MRRIGFVGLGKLGLPCAVAIAARGFDVMGTDLDPTRMTTSPQPYREAGPDGRGDFNDHLATSSIRFGTVEDVVAHAELLFVAVQTPHDPRFEGITPLPDERVDFDYTHLREAITAINEASCAVGWQPNVAVISTVLPGTTRRELLPLLETSECSLVYNPFFIAMGTTMRDLLNPEFVLLGSDDPALMDVVAGFYRELYLADPRRSMVRQLGALLASDPGRLLPMPPTRKMSIESAELTKVAYNTYISQKIAFANTVMEICHRLDGRADCDEVIDALSCATKRLVSPAYLRGGMGDGGGCHPRDNIAMSWLARELDLSHDLFDDVMRCREDQARWLARLLVNAAPGGKRAIVGYAFKPGTNLVVGSPALLVRELTRAFPRPTMYDHHVGEQSLDVVQGLILGDGCTAFLIGCKHPEHARLRFPPGSVVIDPFRYMPAGDGWTVVRLGERRGSRVVERRIVDSIDMPDAAR